MRGLLYIFMAVYIFFAGTANAAKGNISGMIKDSSNDEPLSHVTVVIEGTKNGCVSDNAGKFHINNLSAGKYKLIVSLIGYETEIKEINVECGKTTELSFLLNDSPLTGRGVVVTATRTPRYIKEVPVYTEVITREAIEGKAAHNIYEALEGTPGIRVEQQCQACNFSVLRMQGLGADHTQILFDGLPIYSGLASVYGLQQMSTAEINQIEVVKGAGSALYGSNAVAGAINIISKAPHKTEGKVGIEFGEYGTNTYELSAGVKDNDLALFLFAQQTRGDEIDETGNGYRRDEVNHPDGVTDRVRTNNKSAGFNLYVNNMTESDQIIIRGRVVNENRQGGELIDNLFENPFSPGSERIITDRYSGELGYSKSFAQGKEINCNFSYSRHKRNATNDTFLGDYLDVNGENPSVEEMRPYLADEDLYTASLNYIHPLGSGKHRILTGMHYSRNNLNESGKYVIVDEDDPLFGEAYTSFSEKHADELGIYIQDEFKPLDNLEIVAGVRYDHHASEDNFKGSGNVVLTSLDAAKLDESTVNPRFAIKCDINNSITLRGNFGTGFRVPYGFSEDLHLCSGSPRVYKGANLKPEKSISYGFTIDYMSSGMGLNLNLYRTELKNKIAFVDAGEVVSNLGYTYEWNNIDDGYVMGAEFGAEFALTSDLAAAFNFAMNRSEYDNSREDWIGTPYENMSKKFSRYPETAGGLKLEYSPLDWVFTVDADYKGKMYIDLTEPADESDIKIKETETFVIINARVSRTLFKRYKVYLGVKNLTDYIQEEKHVDDAAFMYAPVYGRLIYTGFQITM